MGPGAGAVVMVRGEAGTVRSGVCMVSLATGVLATAVLATGVFMDVVSMDARVLGVVFMDVITHISIHMVGIPMDGDGEVPGMDRDGGVTGMDVDGGVTSG